MHNYYSLKVKYNQNASLFYAISACSKELGSVLRASVALFL